MTGPEVRARTANALLVALSIAVLFAGATVNEIQGTAVLYASLARAMADSGDPTIVYRGADAYLLKPPLMLWLTAAAVSVLGPTSFAGTLFARLAGLLCVALTWFLGRRLYSPVVGWYAGLVLVTTSTFHHYATALRMDALLTAAILLAFLGYLHAPRRWGPYAFCAGIAIGIMTKGPPALAPLILVPVHAWLARPALGRRSDWLKASLLLLLPLCWYGYLFDLHGLRVVTELAADAARGAPPSAGAQLKSAFSEYVLRPGRQYWPWLPFMLIGGVMAVRRSVGAQSPMHRAHAVMLLVWVSGVLVVASLKPDHDIRYLFPALPPLAILAGMALERVLGPLVPRWLLPPVAVAAVAASVLVVTPTLVIDDTRAEIAAMRERLDREFAPGASVLVVGSNPNNDPGPRRQHPEVDWVHYYFGRPARVVVPSQAAAIDLSAEPVVLVARYGKRERVLAALRLQPEIIATEMALAVPRR